MSKSEKIRQASINLDIKATNQQIIKYCTEEYGFTPSSQHVLAAVGAERERLAECFTGRELMDVKKFIKSKFDGDINRLEGAMKVVKTNGRLV